MAKELEDIFAIPEEQKEGSKTDSKKTEDKKKEDKSKKEGKAKTPSISSILEEEPPHEDISSMGITVESEETLEQQARTKEFNAISDYTTIKTGLERLNSYEELSRQYSLTQDQLQAVRNIYSQIKEAEGHIEKFEDNYHTVSEKMKEMSDVSKRIISEITGSYIKDISEYRHTS